MNPRSNCFLQSRDVKGHRNVIILSLAIAVLLNVGIKCRAVDLPNAHYNLTRIVCKDRLVEWETDSLTRNSETPQNKDGDPRASAFQPSGVFMRGTWKQGATSSVLSDHVIRAPFLSSSEGMFDFFSAQWFTVMGTEYNSQTAQNISGQIFFREIREHGARPSSILLANGLYNSNTGEICLIGCVQTSLASETGLRNSTTSKEFVQSGQFLGDDTTGCIVRGLLTFSSRAGRKRSQGVLESLKAKNEAAYFTSLNLVGSMIDNEDQVAIYHFDVSVRSLIYAVEALIIAWQIAYSIRSPSAHLVSILMILTQVIAMVILAVNINYIPIHLLTYQRFTSLISSATLIPWLVFVVVILLNGIFLWVVLNKRRRATQRLIMSGGEENPRGLGVGTVCTMIYLVTGVVFWALQNFETYLQVVWCWFLLPQVLANAFWDARVPDPPLHWAYVVGVSSCRIAYVGFNAIRPTIYGYDDLSLFPKGWFWGITGTVLVFASCALLQERYGGRSFFPQSWFGYQLLASSAVDAKKGEGKAEDAFDL